MELRSADPSANPYLAFLLLIRAGLYGIDHKLSLPQSTDINLFNASSEVLNSFRSLPASLEEARMTAAASSFVKKCLPAALTGKYCSSY